MAGLDSPWWPQWVAWSGAHGHGPAPASAAQVSAFLDAVKASGGEFTHREAASSLVEAYAELGLPAPVVVDTHYLDPRVPGDANVHADYTSPQAVPLSGGLNGYCRAKLGALPAAAGFAFASAMIPTGAGFVAYQAALQRIARARQRLPGWAQSALFPPPELMPYVLAQLQGSHQQTPKSTLHGFTLGAGRVSPSMAGLTFAEAETMLKGLVDLNVGLYKKGVPLPSPYLFSGELRYIRRDDKEDWKPVDRVFRDGGGDCEDLAAANAAERTYLGNPSRVRIIRTGPRTAHAIVEDIRTGQRFDPSITGGMGWAE